MCLGCVCVNIYAQLKGVCMPTALCECASVCLHVEGRECVCRGKSVHMCECASPVGVAWVLWGSVAVVCTCGCVCVRYVLKGDRMLGGVRVHSPPLTSILPLKLSPLWGGSGGPSPLPKCYRFHPRTRTEGFSAQSVLKLLTVPPLCFISSK